MIYRQLHLTLPNWLDQWTDMPQQLHSDEAMVELAVEFALHHLQPEGALVCKTFHGSGYSQQAKLFKDSFRVVKPIKPKASRDKSSETFFSGLGPKP